MDAEKTEFTILGPLAVHRAGAELTISGGRQRSVLAVLLVEAGRVVPVERLERGLWDHDPPASARMQVQIAVSRLRKVLGAEAIRTRSPGYSLHLTDGDELDATRFDRLVTEAGQRQRSGDLPGAAAALRAALALWHGPALAGLTGSVVVAAAAGLEERRLRAWEQLVDVELALGRPDAVLGDLTALVDDHPTREPLRARLMLALYRSGRQADALAVYRRGRQVLVDEFGLEPGAELQQLEHAILTADPGLDRHPRGAAAPAVAAVTPAQLPPDVAGFTGRAEDLAQLDALPQTEPRQPGAMVIAVVAGAAGVGKTALAVHWAHRVADRFPDGQLYVNLRGFDADGQATDPAAAVRGFLEALGVPLERVPADLAGQVGLYRSLLAGRRVLVVLDNARDADQARPLLPGRPGCAVVVTSRNPLLGLVAADGAHPLRLDILTPEEARDLLARRLGRRRLEAEPEAVEQIVDACARLPLALTIAAARAATHPGFPLAALAAELAKAGDRLDALSAGDATSEVRAVFSWSYTALTPAAARLFRLLGLHPGPDVSAAAAASLAGRRPAEVRPLLAELARTSLIVEHAPDRYTFHDLLGAYAADLARSLDSDQERAAGVRRLLDHHTHTAHAAARLLDPHRDPPALPVGPAAPGVQPEQLTGRAAASGWLTAEYPVLLAAVSYGADRGFDTHTWQLAWSLDTFLDRLGHWQDLTGAWQAAVRAADRLDEPTAQAVAHRLLAWAYIRLEQRAEARTHLRHAVELFARADDRIGQARTRLDLGYLLDQEGRTAEALEHARQSAALYQAAGHRRGQALAVNGLGWYHSRLGDHRQALGHCEHARALFQQLGDRTGEAASWDSLGHVHAQLGEYGTAVECFERASVMFRDLGERYEEALTLARLGDARRRAGEPVAARTAWQHALTLLTELGHPEADAVRAKLHRLVGLVRRSAG